jgi:hypothetical protein
MERLMTDFFLPSRPNPRYGRDMTTKAAFAGPAEKVVDMKESAE